jgi:sugar fermentation stimulation protein A
MQFIPALQPAILVQRYKRFLADVVTPDGETLTLHCRIAGSSLSTSCPT